MPYYRITITDIYGKITQGVRFDYLTEIDTYYRKVCRKAITTYRRELKTVDVVMLTSNCPDVLKYLETRRQTMEYKPTEVAKYQGKEKYGYDQYK
jgi:hypothetical protein